MQPSSIHNRELSRPYRTIRTLGLSTLLLMVALVFFVGATRHANAANVSFVGTVTYSYLGNTAVLTAARVENFDAGGFSGTLHMELWAFSTPYSGSALIGYKLAQHSLGQLLGGFYLSGISSGTILFTPPPDGTWYFVMVLTEYIGSGSNNGYTVRDWSNFPAAVVIGAPPPPPPPSVSPQVGNWSNPNEQGTGFAFDFKHGVLVVVFFSFEANGTPQWYIASGPVSGTTFTGSLDKFVAGQCISASCPYRFPTYAGSDGPVTIVFTSNTSGTMYLPGGRTIPITPTSF